MLSLAFHFLVITTVIASIEVSWTIASQERSLPLLLQGSGGEELMSIIRRPGNPNPQCLTGQQGSDIFKALGLTPREAEVLYWIAEGKRDREIACIIGISLRTAQNHVASILHKLLVETRTAAARIALERLLSPRHSHVGPVRCAELAH